MLRMVQASNGRSSQLLRGVLDVCMLALIEEKERYGYEIVRQLEDRGLELVGEGSIYPVLSRLQRFGLVDGYSVPSGGGPPRKYYRITEQGRRALGQWTDEWDLFAKSVSGVLKGGGR